MIEKSLKVAAILLVATVLIFQEIMVPSGIIAFPVPFIISVGLDPVVSQAQKLISALGQFSEVLPIGTDHLTVSFSQIFSELSNASGGIISATKSVFNNITAIFSLLILSVYLSLDWENIKQKFVNLFPKGKRPDVEAAIVESETSVGVWLKGQLVLMFIIGLVSYIGLLLIGVEYPLALAIIAGLLEIIPIIGPVISAIIAAIVASMASPIKGLFVVLFFTLVQQLEGNVLVPKIMQKVSGFSPIIILLALLVGSDLFGMLGAVLAVPIMMLGWIIFKRVRW